MQLNAGLSSLTGAPQTEPQVSKFRQQGKRLGQLFEQILHGKSSDLKRLEQLLSNVDVQDPKWTIQIDGGLVEPLIVATSHCRRDLVKLLLQLGASTRAVGLKGDTPLLMSSDCKKGSKVVEILLDHGADKNAKNFDGQTALMLAAAKGNIAIVKVCAQQ